MLTTKLTVSDIFGGGPLAASLGRLGVTLPEQLLLLRDRIRERLPESHRAEAAALGQVQVLCATPLTTRSSTLRRKPADGPCPLAPGLLNDFLTGVAPALDIVRYSGELEVWTRSRMRMSIENVCRGLEAVLARLDEVCARPEIIEVMRGVCFTTADTVGTYGSFPTFPAPIIPGYFSCEESLLAPLVRSPICANFLNAAAQPADAVSPIALPTGQITAYWPELVPARPLPRAETLRRFVALADSVPKWLERDQFALGFLTTAFSTVLLACGLLWGVQDLVGGGFRLGIWGLDRIIRDTVTDQRVRFSPPTTAAIYRGVHRYYLALATGEFVPQAARRRM